MGKMLDNMQASLERSLFDSVPVIYSHPVSGGARANPVTRPLEPGERIVAVAADGTTEFVTTSTTPQQFAAWRSSGTKFYRMPAPPSLSLPLLPLPQLEPWPVTNGITARAAMSPPVVYQPTIIVGVFDDEEPEHVRAARAERVAEFKRIAGLAADATLSECLEAVERMAAVEAIVGMIRAILRGVVAERMAAVDVFVGMVRAILGAVVTEWCVDVLVAVARVAVSAALSTHIELDASMVTAPAAPADAFPIEVD